MKEENRNTIKSLLSKIREDDDQSAFRELFYLLYHRLVHFCNQYVEDKEVAEEIVSDLLTQLWVDREKTKDIVNPETYLFISVKNRSINYLKKYSKFKVVHLADAMEDQLVNTHDPEKELEKRELNFKMNEAIESLSRQCKIVFNLVKEDGLRYKDVAEILEISPRTVETQLVRALKKLNTIIEPYVAGERGKKKNKSFGTLKKLHSVIFFLGL